jgi:hypothetical protein
MFYLLQVYALVIAVVLVPVGSLYAFTRVLRLATAAYHVGRVPRH